MDGSEANMAEAMARALAPARICPGETHPEIEAHTDWAGLLAPAVAVPTAPTPLDTLEARKRYDPDRLLLLMDTVLAEAECERLNKAAEAIGFGRTDYPQDYRGNLRLIVTDAGLAKALWERLRPHVPATLQSGTVLGAGRIATWRAVGLNECFRLAKYYEGAGFGAHSDAWFTREQEEMSFFTVNIYTNTVPTEHGGRTRFYSDAARPGRKQKTKQGKAHFDLQVQPVAGRAVVFRHGPRMELIHDGERLGGGVKYLLRTDVMYQRVA